MDTEPPLPDRCFKCMHWDRYSTHYHVYRWDIPTNAYRLRWVPQSLNMKPPLYRFKVMIRKVVQQDDEPDF